MKPLWKKLKEWESYNGMRLYSIALFGENRRVIGISEMQDGDFDELAVFIKKEMKKSPKKINKKV